ncbi:hypothetical protein C1646_754231 [Rhizophagus diaphanus]|nr:hypothetical protein C1646_754231 [Rhizophagus diaphanus] [Rhizophagus sp. MUCL 43196]
MQLLLYIDKFSKLKQKFWVQCLGASKKEIEVWNNSTKILHYESSSPVECQPSQWSNEELINSLYKYHLKRQTIVRINWLQLFKQWESGENIIEINAILTNLYPKNYQFSDREMQAWSSMLKAASCTDITLFNSEVSPKLQNRLGVSPTTINAARKYATLNGSGYRQIKKPIIIRSPPFTKEIEDQFEAFFSDKANVSMSSYKVDPRTNRLIPYLFDQKESLWKRFSEIYPNGMKRTAFIEWIEDGSYRLHIENLSVQNKLLQDVELIKCHMKREYIREISVESNGHAENDECIDHYLPYAFGKYNKMHGIRCSHCPKLYSFFDELESILPAEEIQLIDNKKEKLLHYLAYQTRKMYILPKSARESKFEFFGKKGCTLHSILMYTKSENEKLNVAAFDHWSADTRQDAWFIASSLHAVFEVMNNKPKWVILISDNEPHYHNSEMMIIMAHWKDWYDIEVKSWIFLEVGEAKMAIDSHHIVHAIKRYVRIGFEIREGSDIENSIKDLCSTSPINGPFAGSIQARTLPNIVQINNGIIDTENNFNVNAEFQLASGWALKANQKFGKRGNADKSDRYSANDILSELMANREELDSEIIPKIEIIENWISRYSAAYKREMAAIALERQVQNQP